MNNDPPSHMRQLTLTLPHRVAMTREDFLVGDANAEAVAVIDAWPEWPSRVVLLAGPVGSGKTHLVEIWREATGGTVIDAQQLREADVDALASQPAVAVEDLHGGPFDEAALFHLLNRTGERNVPVLLTSRMWASALPLAIPDLASRLRAARPVELGEPDDDLLRRVMVKLFADRQLNVDQSVIDYIAVRMERSLQGASAIVEELDRDALAARSSITRKLAAEAISRIFDRTGDASDI